MNKNQKGKQATRGLKQILIENQETIKFYFQVLAVSNVIYVGITFLLFWESFTAKYMFLFISTSLIAWVAWYFMKNMANPELDYDGNVVGPGSDLNMQGHVSEYFKDAILFSVIVHGLSLISNYFWLLLIIVPVYLFVLLWKNFLGPWFFAPAPEEPEEQDNKKGKREKKKIVRVR